VRVDPPRQTINMRSLGRHVKVPRSFDLRTHSRAGLPRRDDLACASGIAESGRFGVDSGRAIWYTGVYFSARGERIFGKPVDVAFDGSGS